MVLDDVVGPAPMLDADGKAAAAIARAESGALLDRRDIMAIWRIGKSQFHRLDQQHAFDQFKVHPPIGTKCFSGTLITKYLSGNPVYPVLRSRRR